MTWQTEESTQDRQDHLCVRFHFVAVVVYKLFFSQEKYLSTHSSESEGCQKAVWQ